MILTFCLLPAPSEAAMSWSFTDLHRNGRPGYSSAYGLVLLSHMILVTLVENLLNIVLFLCTLSD